MGYPPQPHDPYQQSGPQYPQAYQPQPYSQPHMPVPSGPQYGPVQYTTVKEWGFNPIAMIIHGCLWVFLHWWLALITIGFWLIVAIPVSFIGWRVTRHLPVQQVHYQQPPYPPQVPPGY
ncbi:hypothetical protein ETD86_34890 [Nonomuraea turkmeniaca]|uniref:Uncharacterized protein n=1 Tax=Nonomuraea turkmeniaca TaxID=103838 RepID=A0A5S4FQX2_9ACTN|nr:DUF3824 domain-containing protein [Nonomuraea turkmeniaca]TMR11758.1 hypothetical protein ETD86_34890 [Nonomuraea turkmeniaca]